MLQVIIRHLPVVRMKNCGITLLHEHGCKGKHTHAYFQFSVLSGGETKEGSDTIKNSLRLFPNFIQIYCL